MIHTAQTGIARARDVQIRSGAAMLHGDLSIPTGAKGVVVFAHGSGSSRHSPRNQFVARTIRESGNGTLLFDLLTEAEEREDEYTGEFRFNIPMLAQRLVETASWLHGQPGMDAFGI